MILDFKGTTVYFLRNEAVPFTGFGFKVLILLVCQHNLSFLQLNFYFNIKSTSLLYLLIMSESQPAPPKQEPNVAKQPQKKETAQTQPKKERKPKTGYRLENKKEYQISRRHHDRRERALLMKDISYALFGSRRFKRIVLLATLNNFYWGLMVANTFQTSVVGLSMIVSLQELEYLNFESNEDTVGKTEKHSIFTITLTKYPTEQDKKHAGYHEPKKAQEIQKLIDKIFERAKPYQNKKPRNNDRPKNKRNDDNRQNKDDKRDTNRKEDDRRGKGRYEDQGRNTKSNYNQQRENNSHANTRPRNNQPRQNRREEVDERREYRGRETRRQQPKQTKRSNYEPKHREEKGQNVRGQPKSRGNGRVADHNYDRSHLRTEKQAQGRRENRGPRGPKYRYESDED